MRQKLKTTWAERTELEKWLFWLLFISTALGIFFLCAWLRVLTPWEAVAGTYADWVTATVTAAGLGWAVYTLRATAGYEKKRVDAQQRAEAARVAIDWNEMVIRTWEYGPNEPIFKYVYRGEVYNAASSPIRGVIVTLDGIDGIVYKGDGVPRSPGDIPRVIIDTVVPGAKKKFEFGISWNDETIDGEKESYRVTRAASFVFTDVLDATWTNFQGELTKGPSAK